MPLPMVMRDARADAWVHALQSAAGESPSTRTGESDVRQLVGMMAKQQATLQGLVEMQSELRTVVQTQLQALERKFEMVLRPAGDHGFVVDGELKEGEELSGLGDGHHFHDSDSQPHPFKNGQFRKSSAAQPATNIIAVPESLISRLRSFVRGNHFDSFMGAIIVVNFMVIFTELQWKSYDVEFALGRRNDNNNWHSTQRTFTFVESLFSAIYVVELTLRLTFNREMLCLDWLSPSTWMQIIDAAVIVLSAVDSFILDPIGSGGDRTISLIRFLRIMRALRLLRFLRVLRFLGMFAALRVMVKTISKSFDSLCWSMAVVGFIITLTAILMTELLSEAIKDTTRPRSEREWLFDNYGSAAKSAYSMFEATFSGKWATHLSQPLIDMVSPWFRVFWILYTVAINFAVMRVISAIFLKQTMDVAAVDAERVAAARMKVRERHLETLRKVFAMGDQLGDGVLHRWEFEQMMQNEIVVKMFEELELEPAEVYMLFNIVAEDDGVADQEEFLTGCMRLKSNVRLVDMIQLLHEQFILKRFMGSIVEGLQRIDGALHPGRPWKPKSHHPKDFDSPIKPMQNNISSARTHCHPVHLHEAVLGDHEEQEAAMVGDT